MYLVKMTNKMIELVKVTNKTINLIKKSYTPPHLCERRGSPGGGAFWVPPSGALLVTPRFLLSRVFKLGLEISVNEPRGFFFSPLGSLSPPSSTHASHSPQWVYGRGSWG